MLICESTQLSLELSYNSRFRFHSTCICINMNILVLHASMDISTSFPHLYKQQTTCFFSLCSDHRCKKHRFCFAGVLFLSSPLPLLQLLHLQLRVHDSPFPTHGQRLWLCRHDACSSLPAFLPHEQPFFVSCCSGNSMNHK